MQNKPVINPPQLILNDCKSRDIHELKQKAKEILNSHNHLETKTTITKRNYQNLPKIAKIIKKLQPTRIIFEFIDANKINKDKVKKEVPFKTLVVPYLERIINYLSQHNNEVLVKNIPFCVMPSKAGFIQHSKNDYHPGECNNCFYTKTCPKLSDTYAEKIGKKELNPIERKNHKQYIIANLRLDLQCNADCLFCTVSDDHEEPMNTQQAKNMLFNFAINGFNRVTITGGEPTLRQDLPEILRCAKQNELAVDLQTNGILLEDKKFVKKIAKENILQITINFPSHIESKYNHLMGVQSYQKALRGIKNCIEQKAGTVSIYHVINKENYEYLNEFVDFIQNISDQITFAFAFLRPNGNAMKNKHIVPSLTEMEKYIYMMLKKTTKNMGPSALLEGVPLCFMRGYEQYSSETHRVFQMLPVNYASQGQKQHDNLHLHIFKNLKKKSTRCKSCNLNHICAGVWQEYAEIYGTEELEPTTDKEVKDVLND